MYTVKEGYTLTAVAKYDNGDAPLEVDSTPVTFTVASFTVKTGSWNPNPAYVGESISGQVQGSLDPSSIDGGGSGPFFVIYSWTTAGVWYSQSGTSGTFESYGGNNSVSWTQGQAGTTFTAVFGDVGFYILEVQCTATVYSQFTGLPMATLTGTGYIGNQSDIDTSGGGTGHAQMTKRALHPKTYRRAMAGSGGGGDIPYIPLTPPTLSVMAGMVTPNPSGVTKRVSVQLSGMPSNAPTANAQLKVDGPHWSWSVVNVQESQDGQTWTSPNGGDYKFNGLAAKSSPTLIGQFNVPAFWQITVSATVVYHCTLSAANSNTVTKKDLMASATATIGGGTSVCSESVSITRFSLSETWAMGPNCTKAAHQSTCYGVLLPVAAPDKLIYSIDGSAYGATIDASSGVVTPGMNASGKIKVKAASSSTPSIFAESSLNIRAHPTGYKETVINPNEPTPSNTYGATFTNLLSSTGGSLVGVMTTESIATISNTLGISDSDISGIIPGHDTVLNVAGFGDCTDDEIYTPSNLIDINKYLPVSPPAKTGLPKSLVQTVTKYWICPLDTAANNGKQDLEKFTSVKASVTLSGNSSSPNFNTTYNGIPHNQVYQGKKLQP